MAAITNIYNIKKDLRNQIPPITKPIKSPNTEPNKSPRPKVCNVKKMCSLYLPVVITPNAASITRIGLGMKNSLSVFVITSRSQIMKKIPNKPISRPIKSTDLKKVHLFI
jgi:hypothetical protein